MFVCIVHFQVSPHSLRSRLEIRAVDNLLFFIKINNVITVGVQLICGHTRCIPCIHLVKSLLKMFVSAFYVFDVVVTAS